MPRNLSDRFFGSIALKNGMLTRDQLTQALRVQWERTRDGSGPTLGEVCRALGFLTEPQVDAIVLAQAKSEVMLEDSLLGQICLKNRLLTRGQLEDALDEQRALGGARLGDLLCQKGYIDRQQLHAVLKTQDRLKSGRLRPVIVPPERPPQPAAATAVAAPKPKPTAKRKAGPKPPRPRKKKE